MVDIPEIGDDFHEMWIELVRLGADPPAPWTLIGAQMVALHGWSAGRDPIRPSRDADILINVRMVTNGTSEFSNELLDQGYVFDGASPEDVGHRFAKGAISIDILAPDGIGERANLRTAGTAHTVQVPGGTQALHRSGPMSVRSRSVEGDVPVPNLLGALLVKTRAIAVDDDPSAQRRDAAFLLSLVVDPEPLIQDLAGPERGWLRRHPYLANPEHECYRGVDAAEDAAIVFRRLTET